MRIGIIARGSVPVLERPERDAPLVTEVVVGERLEIFGSSLGWFEVAVPSHASRLDPRGYPGWVRDDALVDGDAWAPDLRVVRENPAGLPLGSLLESHRGGVSLPDGGMVELRSGFVLPIGEPDGRSAVDIAESLLRLPYRWGGTDSTTGMDCSGVVFRVMHLCGSDVPRDADDQYEEAPFKSREGWGRARVGDLIFFGEDSVTHVGFYPARAATSPNTGPAGPSSAAWTKTPTGVSAAIPDPQPLRATRRQEFRRR